MKTQHHWFRSGKYTLLAHLDGLHLNNPRLGVVVVPPFGWEDVCSYRPLRFMARKLAKAGIPTLRYDLPGTGDSSGGARDPGLFDAWIQSVSDAAEDLRASTGVEDVAVVGIRLGAALALLAAERGASLQDLVLWGAPATGRALLRELRAAANMERWECLTTEDAQPHLIAGFEVGGFLIAPETQRSLESFDVSKLPTVQVGRILLLSRDGLPHEAKVAAALQSWAACVELAVGHGFSMIMGLPHESLPPDETSSLVAGFLSKHCAVPGNPAAGGPSAGSRASIGIHRGDGFLESNYTVETASGPMFGILAEPSPTTPQRPECILYLNPGGVRHTGPNRMWVESSRRWAARGVTSLRLDLPGVGESDGERNLDIPSLYQDRLVDHIETGIHSLKSRAGVQRFIAIGLCSGAFWAFHAALRFRDVHAAILLNPRLFFWDPDADQRRILRRTAQGLMRLEDWSRLMRGGICLDDVKRAARTIAARFRGTRPWSRNDFSTGTDAMAHAWSTLERDQKRVTLVFREGEPLLAEMEKAVQLPPDTYSFVRHVRLPNVGHTFRPLWAQGLAHDLIDAELRKLIRGDAPKEGHAEEFSFSSQDISQRAEQIG